MLNEGPPDSKKYYSLFDGLSSIIGLTKGDGTKENSYDDDPYGNMLHQTEGVSNPWKFAGGFLDSSTGLYKFGTRYDDPTLGRWTQQDPVGGSLGNPDSLNRYLYAGDDPVNFTDPSGEDPFLCFLIGIGLFGVALIVAAVLVFVLPPPLDIWIGIGAALILGAGTAIVTYECLKNNWG